MCNVLAQTQGADAALEEKQFFFIILLSKFLSDDKTASVSGQETLMLMSLQLWLLGKSILTIYSSFGNLMLIVYNC